VGGRSGGERSSHDGAEEAGNAVEEERVSGIWLFGYVLAECQEVLVGAHLRLVGMWHREAHVEPDGPEGLHT